MPEIMLHGCAPEPLMSYLKALGVLRLVAEQADSEARGAWRGGVFVLSSTFDEAALLRFFQEDYKPTPLVVPWSGKDFFEVKGDGDRGPFTKTPTGSKVVEAFLASESERLEPYRQTIRVALKTMSDLGIDQNTYFQRLNSQIAVVEHSSRKFRQASTKKLFQGALQPASFFRMKRESVSAAPRAAAPWYQIPRDLWWGSPHYAKLWYHGNSRSKFAIYFSTHPSVERDKWGLRESGVSRGTHTLHDHTS